MVRSFERERKEALETQNNKYEIFIDASVDIDPGFIEKNNIHIIPMKYIIDDQEFLMDRPQTEEELAGFYQKMKEGSITGTSQITPYTYEHIFKEAASEGKNILYLCLSSGLSSTYESSLSAAQSVMDDFPEISIECVDTLGATGGMGLLLLLAIRGRSAGKSLKENASFLRENALNTCYWFMVEDLEYLKRGGRISATAAFAGNVLNLKPVLKINDEGKLINISKQRGVPRALKYLLECYENAHDDTLGNDVIITFADCRDRAEKIAKDLQTINPDASIQLCPLGPVIGAHTGPGFIAILHFGNRNFR